MPNAKILVVDDDPKIRKIVEHSLRNEGFEIIMAGDGITALDLVDRENPHLVILDLMMPGMDGFEVCRRLRKQSEIPILILSARDGEVDKIVGFNLGVDDYLTKPFSPSELMLRVKAILRRSRPPEQNMAKGDVVHGRLRINQPTRKVWVGEREIDLTAKEFDTLWFLANHPNQVFSRSQLLNQIWETEYYGDTNTVTVLIRRLREKIEDNPADPKWIKTVWSIGYKFEID